MDQRQRRLPSIKPMLEKWLSVCWDILDITRLSELGERARTLPEGRTATINAIPETSNFRLPVLFELVKLFKHFLVRRTAGLF